MSNETIAPAASCTNEQPRITEDRITFFYKNRNLASFISTNYSVRTVAEQNIKLAQLDHAQTAKIMSVDRANSVLGIGHGSMKYSPYGYIESDSLSTLLAFSGQRFDRVLQGYVLGDGYRTYNPGLRRFTSPDTLSPFEVGGLNPYAYCLNDPINNIDPSGHKAFNLSKAFKNLLGRKAKITERINNYNKAATNYNNDREKMGLFDPFDEEGNLDIYKLYRNKNIINKMSSKPSPTLPENDKAYAAKHKKTLKDISDDQIPYLKQSKALIKEHSIELDNIAKSAEHWKPSQGAQQNTNIRSTASTPSHFWFNSKRTGKYD
ncbi:RHS repeat-associated core domain-containing protein [Pseudomonas putida]|uniref:RHS repeat-associated core domain-containing protein n=1 Tax=Pseudomonas putida TaxID=303 RepID=UPI0039064018